MSRTPITFDIRPSELDELKRLAKLSGKTCANAARIILLSGKGLSLSEIATRVGLSRSQVCHWRRCYREKGLPGLTPRRIRKRTTSTLAEAICNGQLERYTQAELARKHGVHQSTVSRTNRFLCSHGAAPWKGPRLPHGPNRLELVAMYLDYPYYIMILAQGDARSIDHWPSSRPIEARCGQRSLPEALWHFRSSYIFRENVGKEGANGIIGFLKSIEYRYANCRLHMIYTPLEKLTSAVDKWIDRRWKFAQFQLPDVNTFHIIFELYIRTALPEERLVAAVQRKKAYSHAKEAFNKIEQGAFPPFRWCAH